MNDQHQQKYIDQCRECCSEKSVVTDQDIIAPWLTDWRGRYHGAAFAMLMPQNSEQLSHMMRLSQEHSIIIVPQGGNSGMSGGATPDKSGNTAILSLRKMDQIRKFDAENRTITVDAGVVLENLHHIAEEKHLRFPLTLGGKGSATIGGLISTNAGGTQVLRHGTMRALTLGLEVVLPNGEIINELQPLKKDNRGFDIKQLFIGSEGILGIVSGATLQLLPALSERVVIWAGVKSIHDARKLLLFMEEQAGKDMEGFEIIPQSCLQSVLSHMPDARNPLEQEHGWNCLIEIAKAIGDDRNIRDLAEHILGDAFENELLDDAVIAANDSQAEAFWTLRESISGAERARGAAVQHDISVPVPAMPDFIEHAISKTQKHYPGTHAFAFGHLGDGNVHFHVKGPEGADREKWPETEGKIISGFIHDLVVEFNGSISAEHGIGQMKADELLRLDPPPRTKLLATLKKSMDPQMLLNPGKLIPLEFIIAGN